MTIDPQPRVAQSPGATLVIERPPPGLARGKYPASAWAIALLGGAAVLSVVVYFALRLRRRPRT